MWFVAVGAMLLGACLVWFERLGASYRRQARRIERTPTTRIADAKPGERVAINGRATQAEEGVIAIPGGPDDGLYYSLGVDELTTDAKGRTQRKTVVQERSGVPFLVEDGSGRPAWIDPRQADVNVRITSIDESTLSELPPALRELVNKSGALSSGPSSRVAVTLVTIASGDPIYALGSSELVTRAEATGHYRGGARSILAMKGHGDDEVLVGKTQEDVLFLQQLFAGALDEVSWKGAALLIVGVALSVWLLLH